MKTLLIAGLSVIIIMIMSWASLEEPYEEYDQLIVESETLSDSALLYLKEIHDHNDSLLDKYFSEDGEE